MKAAFAFLCALSASLVIAKVCPGGGQSCQSYMTCCELPSGKQGCCPHSNATCCPDKVHCCPSGYHCHTNSCQKRNQDKVIATTKLMIDYEEPNVETVEGYHFTNASIVAVFCPDQSRCPDGNTCCKLSPTEYGCCPEVHAVCCSDFKTCCPQGMRCNGRGGCIRSVGDEDSDNEVLTSTTAIDEVLTSATAINTICPGGSETCPAGDTCCPTSYGHYGCCPMLAATCCDDRKTCCPHGYRCDGRGSCTRAD